MDIDVTAFLELEHSEFSASRAERGINAGPETWANANEQAKETPLIPHDDIAGAKRFFQGFGAWDQEEIAAWTDDEVNALAIQYISGDIREARALCPGKGPGGINWKKHERLAEAGTIGGRLGLWTDGRVGFYLGE